MAQSRVLIVDDDLNSVRFLQLELEHEGYLVEKAYDGESGLRTAEREPFDLILLDVMMPGLDGMEVLERLRRRSDDTPVILLTAKDAVGDKVQGLDGGADDYVTKPFAIEELLARMRAALKKKTPGNGNGRRLLTVGLLTIDRLKREVCYGGVPVRLTKREFDLLHYLAENHDIVCSRDRLLEKVWEYDFSGETNLVDVYIRYLRNKIDYRFHVELIRTVRGVGYLIKTT